MNPFLPFYIPLVFGLTTVAALLLFVRTVNVSGVSATQRRAMVIFAALAGWLILQAILALNGVYTTKPKSFPPRFLLLGILPGMLVIVLVFATSKGRAFADSLPLKNLTWLNIVRIPVELVLFWLYLNKAVPGLMTFEGRNYDILAGITAPFAAYFGVSKGSFNRRGMLLWNIVCLGLLLNIVVNALLSAPTPLQRFAFDQPAIAILNFPFNWLPSFVVPLVLFGHLTSIRQLVVLKGNANR